MLENEAASSASVSVAVVVTVAVADVSVTAAQRQLYPPCAALAGMRRMAASG